VALAVAGLAAVAAVGGGLALVRHTRLAAAPAAATPVQAASGPANAPAGPAAPPRASASSGAAAAPGDPGIEAAPSVTVTLEAEPRRAHWSLDGTTLAGNPAQATRDARSTHTATASAPGYAEASLLVNFDAAHVERLTLLPLRRGAPHHEAHGEAVAPGPPAAREKPRKQGDEGMTIERDNPFKREP
jgi:hypothetical protein